MVFVLVSSSIELGSVVVSFFRTGCWGKQRAGLMIVSERRVSVRRNECRLFMFGKCRTEERVLINEWIGFWIWDDKVVFVCRGSPGPCWQTLICLYTLARLLTLNVFKRMFHSSRWSSWMKNLSMKFDLWSKYSRDFDDLCGCQGEKLLMAPFSLHLLSVPGLVLSLISNGGDCMRSFTTTGVFRSSLLSWKEFDRVRSTFWSDIPLKFKFRSLGVNPADHEGNVIPNMILSFKFRSRQMQSSTAQQTPLKARNWHAQDVLTLYSPLRVGDN